jgi:hypothetical protein
MTARANIQKFLEHGDAVIPVDKLAELGAAIANHMQGALTPRTGTRNGIRLYASELGEKCHRKLWFKQHGSTIFPVEPLPYTAKFKFLYGNVIEELALTLAEEAGCEVADRQARVESDHIVDGELITVSGRIDAVIDGAVVDVKSSSSQAMKKYGNGYLAASEDTFGYREQLYYYYHYGDFSKPIHQPPYFLMVDKTLGHIEEVKPEWMDKQHLDEKIEAAARTVMQSVAPSISTMFFPVPEGKSGNMKLCTTCSYCPFKKECWNYEAYAYSTGPVFLTEVKVKPKVPMMEALSNTVPF